MSRLGDKLKATRKHKPQWKPDPRVLLCPPVPQPMHGTAPRVVLGKVWWDATRTVAYASTGYHCLACGVHKYRARLHQWLEAHEQYRLNYRRGRMTYLCAVPLCHFCHNYIHTNRLRALKDKGEIESELYDEILQHGDRLLLEAKLTKPAPYGGPMAKWGSWRLVIEGTEYPPFYKDIQAWTKAYDR